MNDRRCKVELVSEGCTLFAAGGQGKGLNVTVYKKSMEYMRPAGDNSWKNVRRELLVEEGGRLVATRGIVYFVGWDKNTSVCEYHGFQGMWSSAVRRYTLRTPRKRFAAAAANGIIYVVGGLLQVYGVFRETKSLQSFDPVTGKTTDLANTVKPLGVNVRAVVIERP